MAVRKMYSTKSEWELERLLSEFYQIYSNSAILETYVKEENKQKISWDQGILQQ